MFPCELLDAEQENPDLCASQDACMLLFITFIATGVTEAHLLRFCCDNN